MTVDGQAAQPVRPRHSRQLLQSVFERLRDSCSLLDQFSELRREARSVTTCLARMVDHGLKTLDGPVELVQSFPSLILHKLLLDRYELSHARPQSEKLTIDFMIDKGRYQR